MSENSMLDVHQGLMGDPLVFNFVLGQVGAMPATALTLMHLVRSLALDVVWEVTGHSGHDPQAALWAIALGGHACAGYEDCILYRSGCAASNAGLIQWIVRIAREIGWEIASPAKARALLGVSPPAAHVQA
jgi:3-keto-5-aminohexanoate cleavage enzyme